MYREVNAYADMFKKHIINEADDDLSLDELDAEADTPEPAEKEEPAKKEPPKVEKPEEKKSGESGEADMKFSIDLATEFSNTVNEFTNVCAKIVEIRNVNKETSDKFYDLYAKIKNLADAASKTI
jgi:hypothetical protein